MRIIFLDIDGTLIDCCRGMDHPSSLTIETIRKLQTQGDIVLIVSGRPKCLLDKSILDLNTDGLILANGSYIEYRGQKIFEQALDTQTIQKIINFGYHNHCPFYLETNHHVYTQDLDDQLHHDYFDEWKLDYALRTYDHLEHHFLSAMMALKPSEDLMEACRLDLKEDIDVTRQIGLFAFDLNNKGVNKGTAIRQFIQSLNCDSIETFAFGDGYNDFSMMEAVDHPIAMGNACEELKSIAEYVTKDVLEDGIYHGLKHYQVIK